MAKDRKSKSSGYYDGPMEKFAHIPKNAGPLTLIELYGEPGINDPARPLPKPTPDLICPTCHGDKKVTVLGALADCRKCHGVGRIWSDGRGEPPTAQEKLTKSRQDRSPLLDRPRPPDDDD